MGDGGDIRQWKRVAAKRDDSFTLDIVDYGEARRLSSLAPGSRASSRSREGNFTLEMIDYGDGEPAPSAGQGQGWPSTFARSNNWVEGVRASAAGPRLGRPMSTTSVGGMLELLQPEPYQPLEYDVDADGNFDYEPASSSDRGVDRLINEYRDSRIREDAERAADEAAEASNATSSMASGRQGSEQSQTTELASSKSRITTAYQFDDHGVDVTSDEENNIVKQIRQEISQQLKQEMKDELAVYHGNRSQSRGASSHAHWAPSLTESPSEEMAPELKDALITMRKYDRILRRKMEKEREVKHQRIILQKKLREELEELEKETSGRRELREVRANVDRFLSLAAPPARFGDNDDEYGCQSGGGSVTPLFHTQLPDMASGSAAGSGHAGSSRRGNGSSEAGNGESVSSNDQSRPAAASSSDRKGASGQRATKKGKDFVKRNIELAADAGNAVAMTDDEKKRLEDLLCDIDTVPEHQPPQLSERASSLAGDNSSQASSTHHLQPQPGSVVSIQLRDNGYSYDGSEAERMAAIDHRLQELMAPETWRSLAAVPYDDGSDGGRLTRESLQLFTRTQWGMERDLDAIGEQALKDTHEQREAKLRLQQIEHQLSDLASAAAADIDMEVPRLSNEQLQVLLEQCVRAMMLTSAASSASRLDRDLATGSSYAEEPSATSELLPHGRSVPLDGTSDITDSSSWSLILDHPPPPLPPDTLQRLLEEARREGVGVGRRHQEMADEDAVSSGDSTLDEYEDKERHERLASRLSSQATMRLSMESSASGRLTGRGRQELVSAAGSSSGRSSRYHLPPVYQSENGHFLVQRYA